MVPSIAGLRYFIFSSWEPKRCSAGVAMLACTAMAIGTPAQFVEYPSSSINTSVKE